MRNDMAQLKQLTARSRMAYSLACLESLAAKFNFDSLEFRELVDLLWSYTSVEQFLGWNRLVTDEKWGDFMDYGLWLATDHDQGERLSESDPFADAPEAVIGLAGLSALIGESHLYGAFESDDSETYLEKVLAIMEEQRVPVPSLERFKKNSLIKGQEMGFPAPRSFYVS